MDKQKKREKPQAKKHGPNQWRMNYKGMFGQAKTPELAYLRLVEVMHEQRVLSGRCYFAKEDLYISEIKALNLSLKKCKENHQFELIQKSQKYTLLLKDFRVQHEALNNFVHEKNSAKELNIKNCALYDQVLELKLTIETMKKQ